MAKTSPKEDFAQEEHSHTKERRVIKVESPVSQNSVLIALLIVVSFLIGVLYTKVQYLQGGGSLLGVGAGTQTAGTQNTTAGTQAIPTPIPPGTKVDVDKGHLPVLGDENAKVVIVDFSDFECPFCEQYFTQTFAQVKKDYVDSGKVAYYYRHFPLGFHPSARPAALASECANEQDAFWEYHDLVFTQQAKISGQTPEATKQALKDFAATLNLDTSQFNDCFDSEKYKDNVDKDISEGGASGVSGTPTFYVNGIQLVGAQPYSAFQTLIDQEIEKAK